MTSMWGAIDVKAYVLRVDAILDSLDQIYVEVDASQVTVPSSLGHALPEDTEGEEGAEREVPTPSNPGEPSAKH